MIMRFSFSKVEMFCYPFISPLALQPAGHAMSSVRPSACWAGWPMLHYITLHCEFL